MYKDPTISYQDLANAFPPIPPLLVDGQLPELIKYPLFRIIFPQTWIADSLSVLTVFFKPVLLYHFDLEIRVLYRQQHTFSLIAFNIPLMTHLPLGQT